MIRAAAVSKTYVRGEAEVNALRGVDFFVARGEFVAIMGASGSGKSTLLNIIGCLDWPTSGSVMLDNVETAAMTPDRLAEIRNVKIGFVFQGFNLLSRTAAIENVELPLMYQRNYSRRESRRKAMEALSLVGLADRAFHEPAQLSGGQQQRIAIARALINDPGIILADEPTGNLDSTASLEIMHLFESMNNRGKTVIIVTHERDIARFARRLVEMRDGAILKDEKIPDACCVTTLKRFDDDPEPSTPGQR